MMKLSNRVLEAFGMSETAKRFYSAPLPIKYGWRIKLQREALQGAVKALSEARQELIRRYCEKDVAGEPLVVDDRFTFVKENAVQFSAQFEELLAQELEVNTERVPIPEAVLDAAGSWSANDLEVLAPFIELVPDAVTQVEVQKK